MMMDIVGDRPKTKIVGIIPQRVGGTTLEMTQSTIKGSIVMEKVLISHLGELGFEAKVKDEKADIQEVAYGIAEY
jgi:hydrogenase maturation protease